MSLEEAAERLHDSHPVIASCYLRLLDEMTSDRVKKVLIRGVIDALSEGPRSAAELAS